MNTMTKATGLSFLLVVFAVLGIDALAAGPAADVAAMHAVDQAWLKAYTAGDADVLAGLYDEQAMLMPPGAPAAHGRAAIRAFFVSDIAQSTKAGIALHLGPNPDGGVNGDMGWVSGSYSVTDKSGKVVETGKYLSVSKKKGGKWQYIRDTWNSDTAPPAAAAQAPKS
ncbi:nuclear transport factor 2 family protein [Dokdonella soli]|uniref:DUF4440 domain-containing protein n=1 Tax=Dokdonella soli TaxID=529810 RepID=A0ABP3TJA6_9GAMM